MPGPLARPARGASLVELLVGMMIALMVLAVALQLTLIARARYARMADDALIDDRGAHALELIGMAVRQAGWITDTPASSPMRRWPSAGAPPSLVGEDDCGPADIGVPIACKPGGIPGADALLVRFAGRSSQPDGLLADGTMPDTCNGYGIPERVPGVDDPRAGLALFYLTRAQDGTPQLTCRSPRRENGRLMPETTNAVSLVRGIETLQLLYTLAATPAEPASIRPARAIPASAWHRVRYVHVAVVVRGERLHANPSPAANIALFPELADATRDAIPQDLHFRPTDPYRRRAVFTATLRVRNPLRCAVDAC